MLQSQAAINSGSCWYEHSREHEVTSMLIAPYERVANIKQDVNIRRYNKIVFKRKLRLASFVAAPILRRKAK
jgi:hypothetical protein